MYSTPVLFLIFNRPSQTKKVFEAIRQIKPKNLYVAADGPRMHKAGEKEQCAITRQVVLDGIDWDCEVFTLFRDDNLGCGNAVSGAIDWFFKNVEEGVILEDDCLPAQSFFPFCEELLAKYRDNTHIMHIGGSNFQDKSFGSKNSYYFSNYIHIWGWATWRRAWNLYQFKIPAVIDAKFQHKLKHRFSNKFELQSWKNNFETIGRGRIDTWDVQWVYSIYNNSGIGITPEVNLVSNIGFGNDATHTQKADKNVAELPLQEIRAMRHRRKITLNHKADKVTYKKHFEHGNTHFNHFKYRIGRKFPWVKNFYLRFRANNNL